MRSSWCRSCDAVYKRAYYLRNRASHIAHVKRIRLRTAQRNRLRVWQYLSQHPCVDCGERDIIVLEFDHLRDKRENLTQMVAGGFAWPAIEAEIAKCAVRCANCHRRKTARESGLYERKLAALQPCETPEESVGVVSIRVPNGEEALGVSAPPEPLTA